MPKTTIADQRQTARLYIDKVRSDMQKCKGPEGVDEYVKRTYGGPKCKKNPRKVQNATYAKEMKQAFDPQQFPYSFLAETIKKHSRKGKETLPIGTRIKFDFQGPNNEVLTDENLYNFQLENFENCAIYIGNEYSYDLLKGCLLDKTRPIKDRKYLYFGVFAEPEGPVPVNTQLGFLICHKERKYFGNVMDIALVCSDYGIGMTLFENVLNYLHKNKTLLDIEYVTLHALNYDVAERYGTFSGFQFAGFWDESQQDGNYQYLPLDLKKADDIAKSAYNRHYRPFWRGSILIPKDKGGPRVLDKDRPDDLIRWLETYEDIRAYYDAFYGQSLTRRESGAPGVDFDERKGEYVDFDTAEGRFKEIMVPMVVKL